nr:E3 ubiquitin-protein ligase TRIM56 [Pelodiscus sinensis]|eukprot:XP_025037860.1 E3 ubiquitin-protein ligase TRIM56 [Pelodiscus sinensis]
MASDAPSLSDAITTDFLTCPICLERLRRPKILPCLHTYCQGCLEGLLGEGPGLRCPECREDVPLPQGVDSLKSNFFVTGLLELVRPEGETGLACALCPLLGPQGSHPAGSHPAVSRCLDCADNLCQACAAGHRCSRLTHTHHLVSLQGFLSGQHDEEIRPRRAARWQEHPGGLPGHYPGAQLAPCRPPPTAHFSCSFSVRVLGDKNRPRITGICPLGLSELLLADEENRSLKRFSLQGDFLGTIPVHGGVAPCSVAAIGAKVAYTAGSPGEAVAVSVAGHLEVYNARGELLEKIFPDGHNRLAMVFVASRHGRYVASDWHRRSVVAFDGHGQLWAELGEEQLKQCQPGAVCADDKDYFYVALRELNKVVAFGPGGEALGPFLSARHGIERARVATITGDGRFAVALSNGTVHVFRIQYPGQGAPGEGTGRGR